MKKASHFWWVRKKHFLIVFSRGHSRVIVLFGESSAMHENDISTLAIGICIKIHQQYGPGLFEKVYEEIFCHEWDKTGISYERQVAIPLIHENIKMSVGFRADIILDDKVIIEIKSIETLADIHLKQILSYLRLTNLKLGLLINFNSFLLKNGIKRVVNNL